MLYSIHPSKGEIIYLRMLLSDTTLNCSAGENESGASTRVGTRSGASQNTKVQMGGQNFFSEKEFGRGQKNLVAKFSSTPKTPSYQISD